MEVVATGLSGLVGSRIAALLTDSLSFMPLGRATGTDITDAASVTAAIARAKAPWVFHFAAYTDVQGAEAERAAGEHSLSWKTNVSATETVVGACKKTGKRLLYLSTDYVFDGFRDSYAEGDAPNPLGWYGVTKYEGERRVLSLGDHGLVVRIANPYRANPVGKKDFVHKILDAARSGKTIRSPGDQIFCPTFIDDLAAAISVLTRSDASGIYHVVSRAPLTPFTASKAVLSAYGLTGTPVVSVSFADYFAGRAQVPLYANLKHAKIDSLGVITHSFEEGIATVRDQETA